MTEKEAPPGPRSPSSERADGGGVTGNGRRANHWKQWDAKPEAAGRVSAQRSFGCMVANREKSRDAKPEATGTPSVTAWVAIRRPGRSFGEAE